MKLDRGAQTGVRGVEEEGGRKKKDTRGRKMERKPPGSEYRERRAWGQGEGKGGKTAVKSV